MNRAYVVIEDEALESHGGGNFTFRASITNYGNTPAHDVHFFIDLWGVTKIEQRKDLKLRVFPQGRTTELSLPLTGLGKENVLGNPKDLRAEFSLSYRISTTESKKWLSKHKFHHFTRNVVASFPGTFAALEMSDKGETRGRNNEGYRSKASRPRATQSQLAEGV